MGGATEGLTATFRVVFALASHTDLIGLALDTGTCVLTTTITAGLVTTAFDALARRVTTHTLLADKAFRAFAGTFAEAEAVQAHLTIGGGSNVVIGLAVTIVVFSITDFFLGLRSITSAPFTT